MSWTFPLPHQVSRDSNERDLYDPDGGRDPPHESRLGPEILTDRLLTADPVQAGGLLTE